MDRADREFLEQMFESLRAAMSTDLEQVRINLQREMLEVKAELRNGAKAMRGYTSYVESLLNSVTSKQLSLEEQIDGLKLRVEEIDDLKRRVSELEKRIPPGTAA